MQKVIILEFDGEKKKNCAHDFKHIYLPRIDIQMLMLVIIYHEDKVIKTCDDYRVGWLSSFGWTEHRNYLQTCNVSNIQIIISLDNFKELK